MDAVYVHIPFCKSICPYCAFAREKGDKETMREYVDCLLVEAKNRLRDSERIRTAYIGGGTPSALPIPEIERLLQGLKELFAGELEEWTFECNPRDVDAALARTLRDNDIDRVSLGVQSFAQDTLSSLGRRHREEDIERAVTLLREEGLENISIDMLFAVPGQTLSSLAGDIDRLLALDVPHVSYYSLIIEEDTLFAKWADEGRLTPVDSDTEADMFEMIIQRLTEAGYEHYEISNFAKPGRHSRHNTIIWQDGDYLGLGASAHGKYSRRREENIPSVGAYIASVRGRGHAIRRTYPYEAEKDTLLMGLRLLGGIDRESYRRRFGKTPEELFPKLEKALAAGLLTRDKDRLRLTQRGVMLANEVFILI